MNLRHFIVPLEIEGDHKRATLIMKDDDKHGTINLSGQHVCDFEVETPGSVGNYFIAEQLVLSHIEQLFGVEADFVETGFKPTT